jgi:putative sporulation protein YyaC
MIEYDILKEELRKVMTPDTVFVCIGSANVQFDTFGPLCGTFLKKKGVPYYGDMPNPVNGVNMYDRLSEIYGRDGIKNENIIAIDACLTDNENKINNIGYRPYNGIDPAKGVGGKFPTVGNKSIVFYTLTKKNLKELFKRGVDRSNKQLIRRHANLVTNVIAEVYQEVCNNEIHNF